MEAGCTRAISAISTKTVPLVTGASRSLYQGGENIARERSTNAVETPRWLEAAAVGFPDPL